MPADDQELLFTQELEELLSEGVEKARAREKAAFDELAGPFSRAIVLFGAGNLGRRTLAKLREQGIEPLAFLDNNSARWGTAIDGVEVLSPSEGANRYGTSAVFVITVWGALGVDRMKTRVEQLRKLGCLRVCSFATLYWKYSDTLLPHYAVDLPHLVYQEADQVRQGLRVWADNASKREYLAQLRWRLTMDFDCLPEPVGHAIYFPKDICALRQDEVFVDCGAYDGDTIRLFLEQSQSMFQRLIAFEPDAANFEILKKSVAVLETNVRNRIHLRHAATSNENGRVLIAEGNGAASSIGRGDSEVDAVALDHEGIPTTYLKMDIEGAEAASLNGAAQTIRQHSPVLAISAYHRQNDIWNIPLLIQSINPNYSFFLRPHLLEGFDLVCYGIPHDRLIRNPAHRPSPSLI
jgi:FkbM family methyltransferase